jgi:hypothetical protein
MYAIASENYLNQLVTEKKVRNVASGAKSTFSWFNMLKNWYGMNERLAGNY